MTNDLGFQISVQKREFKKIGKDIALTSGKNLQQILCQKNKPKLLKNSQPGVYQLDCSCSGKYIGESKRGSLHDALNINRIV